MRDVLGPGTILGYCTNVHAGADLGDQDRVIQQVRRVKAIVSAHEPFGFGWWLPYLAAAGVAHGTATGLDSLRESLAKVGVFPFTINGFPFGDFHDRVVKHSVYLPDWSDSRRASYTLGLASVLSVLSSRSDEGSISTLPLGWPDQSRETPAWREAVRHNLSVLAGALIMAYRSEGRWIHVDFEPEPGCVLQRSDDVVRFFHDDIRAIARGEVLTREALQRHVGVCHDVCHAAVMFEDQASVLRAYRNADIKVGKVQISNAIRVPFDEYSESERREAFAQLSDFAEDRYLHQTMIRMPDGEMRFFEDLPFALASVATNQTARGEWRVHFHVPIYLERFGLIQTTRDQIGECLRAIRPEDEIHHFEVETYAWDVLPPELRVDDLAEGIARELQWVIDNFGQGRWRRGPGGPRDKEGGA